MKKLRLLSSLRPLKGKRVLLRVDFNVPLTDDGKILPEGEQRLQASVPTVKRLMKDGAKVIIVSHLGRPEKWDKKLSLYPVAHRFAQILGASVKFCDEAIDQEGAVEGMLDALKNGEAIVLENIRFYPGEEKNAAFFSRRLASLADVYVNDAFAVCHRKAASVVGVTSYLPSAAGLLLEKEIEALSAVLKKPKRPMVVLLGGAKISTKLPTLKNMLKIADRVLIGGGMANCFFRAMGFRTGKSEVGAAEAKIAKKLLLNKKIMLPVDVLAATTNKADAKVRVCHPGDVRAGEYIVDVGTKSIRLFAKEIRAASTIVWNGPVGLFEVKKFSHGSIALGRMVAARSSGKAFGVVGGGETVECLEQTGMTEYVDHVSTGGGAMLEFLSGETLPGITPLMK